MAALSTTNPMNEKPHIALAAAERADDIGRLKSILQLPQLNYIDISAQNALQQALQRWPLLAELSSRQSAAPAAVTAPEETA